MAIRKSLGTPVDEDLKNQFKNECKNQGLEMNETIEIFMREFLKGNIIIKKAISYEVHQKEK